MSCRLASYIQMITLTEMVEFLYHNSYNISVHIRKYVTAITRSIDIDSTIHWFTIA